MMRRLLMLSITVVFLFLYPAAVSAVDRFMGDSAIYAYNDPDRGVPPNVLFVIDNSSTMSNFALGTPYTLGLQQDDPDVLLPWGSQDTDLFNLYQAVDSAKESWFVYKSVGLDTYAIHVTAESYSDFLSTVTCEAARSSLLKTGTYTAASDSGLKSDGTCGSGGAGVVYLGNLLNYHESAPTGGDTQIALVRDAVLNVVDGMRDKVHFGVMEFGHNNKGGQLTVPVSDLSDDTDFSLFQGKLDDIVTYVKTMPGNSRPLAESLLDALFYFEKDRELNVAPVSGTVVADSPLEYRCQNNFIIMIANGDTIGDSSPEMCKELRVADYDRDGNSGDNCLAGSYGNGTHMADDVARYAYDADLSISLAGKQNLVTHSVLVFQPDNDLLRAVAEDGHGLFRQGGNANEVSAALLEVLENIVMEVNTSFVAPVVPVSPENLTYSGSRIFLGFFRPVSQRPWHGNLKKFGLSLDLRITDSNGEGAVCPDPLDSTNVCDGIPSGGFKPDASSYWSWGGDGGEVEQGGTGEVLLSASVIDRNIYSNLSGNPDLTHADNAFTSANVTSAMLGFSEGQDAVDLIRYIYGYDAYDENGDTSVDDSRDWIMGDIQHASPAVINYRRYPFTPTNEADIAVNQTVIFVGGNDGLLHAFRDADGKELWAFLPDNTLPELKALAGTSRSYFVDASPVAYIYDHDRDGNIGPGPEQASDDVDPPAMIDNGQNDKVILIFGQRRGGAAYYALDVTEPDSPEFLWKFDNNTLDDNGAVLFPHLGESWSVPQLHLSKIGLSRKVVAYIGAGYDIEEDSRFGRSGSFPAPLEPAVGEGEVTSDADTFPGADPPALPGAITQRPGVKGRGVYAFEVATLDSNGVPVVPTSVTKVWGYTVENDGGMKFAIPSDVTVLDSDYDGYADRFYVADLSGRLWRFSIGSSSVTDWRGDVIFSPDTASGRKAFYRPSVVQEPGYWMIGFGTGDRAHPLNKAVVDRYYMIKDLGQTTDSGIDDSFLVDITANELQLDETDAETRQSIIDELYSTSKYGWYLDLDSLDQDGNHAGEKVLATSLIYNRVVYFTTYSPDALSVVSADPCAVGNPGTARLYAVDYKTGESVLNFYIGNDDEQATVVNKRAISPAGKVLRREDRGRILGTGIPSGVVVVVPPNGDAEIIIGTGGGLCSEDPKAGGTIYQIYWKDW